MFHCLMCFQLLYVYLSFRVFYRQVSDNSSNFSSVYTEITTVKLTNLTPNSQYLIYAIAISATGIGASNTATAVNRVESEPSEELVAWTDPAFPAFVEVRTLKALLRQKFALSVSVANSIV